jgi:hypothetical protein
MSSLRSRSAGSLHWNDIQAIEEILSKRSVGDHSREIRIGRRNDADVYLDRLRVADALELPLLQDAQQLHLQRHAHRPDFIEEERAPMRLFDLPLSGPDGARERAARVAEELRLEEVFGNGAAVDRHEPVRASWTGVMDGAAHDLFPAARLAGDQDGARCRRDGLQQLKQILHRTAAPDDALEAVTLIELLAEPRVLGAKPALFHCTLERVPQLVELKRLGNEISSAALDDFHGVLDRSETGHHDADDVGVQLERGLDDTRAVLPGESQVGDHHVECEIRQSLDGVLRRLGLDDGESMIRQLLGDRLAQRRFVFDKQQMFRRVSHLGASVF